MRANRSARPARTADARRRRRPLTVRAVDSRGRIRMMVRVYDPAEADNELVSALIEGYLAYVDRLRSQAGVAPPSSGPRGGGPAEP